MRTVTFEVNNLNGDIVKITKPLVSTVGSLKAACMKNLGKPIRDKLDYKIVIGGKVCNNNDLLLKKRPVEDGDVVHATLVKVKRIRV